MNEGDTAGGQRGRNQALPAGIDRNTSTTTNTVQLPTGTLDSITPMSRSLNEDQQQQLEQSQQQQQQPQHQQHQQQQQQSQQMQPAGTPTSSSSSLSSPHKSLPQQQLQQQPSPSSNAAGGNVTVATDASSVPLSSSAPSHHTLQQQQQNVANSASSGSSSGGGGNSSGSVEANNANITSTPGGERTGSGLSESEGGGRGGRGGGSIASGGVAEGGLVPASGASGGGGSTSETPGSEESTFGVVVGEKRAIEDSTGSVTDVAGGGGGGGASEEGAIVGASGVVGKLYTKTNTTASTSSSSSFTPVVAGGIAVGGQGTVSAAVAVAAASAGSTAGGSAAVSKKRIKLETEPEHDISALKKLILEHKYMRLRSIKERYNEHVAELFFLQTGGNMMEYPVWRKKPPTPAFTSFVRSYKLEPLSSNLEEAGEALKQQSTRALSGISTTPGSTNLGSVVTPVVVSGNGSSSSSGGDDTLTGLPQGAEIKIPGVGATPVAVSTTLPAAVAQLSQQGGTPIIPDRVGIGISPAAASAVDRKRQISSASSALGGHMIKSELLETANASPSLTTIGTNGPNVPSVRQGGSLTGGAGGSRGGGSTAGASITGSSSSRGLNNGQQNGALGNGRGTALSSGSLAGQQQQQLGGGVPAGTNSNGPPDQYTNKARQEVFVMQRIQELQKEGLWTEKRLPKVQEPPRPKAHWDYLLEEMVWLAADFAQERKWKKAAARKCARMVQKHFQDKALAAQRAEKAQELQLKRIAAFVAKEIKTFWSNAEKLVEYKQQTKLDERRKKALDQQLSFIVDQTEKYSQQLVEGMNKAAPVPGGAAAALLPPGSKAESLNSSRLSSPLRGSGGLAGGSDDEFCPEAESSDDDEETIAKAEAEAAAEAEDGTKDEVAALQKESEMDLDDFLKHLPKDYLENRDKIVLSDSNDGDGDGEEEQEEEEEEEADEKRRKKKQGATREGEEEDGDKDFSADEDSMDDEDTIREQERKEKNQDHKKEIDELNADNDLTIEELMAKYKNLPPAGEQMDIDSDDDADEVPAVPANDRKRRRTRSQPMYESSDDEDKEEEEDGNDESEGLTGSDDDEEEDDDDDITEDESDESEEAMDAEEDAFGLKHLLDDETGSGETAATSAAAAAAGSSGASSAAKSQSDKDDMLNDAAAIAESIQPKGNTLSSTSVVTPIPTLLKHSLREYQHIGLDWLVTMHDRKLNGILADEMGLGKTIQTISLLAHLACVKGNWGPHLIIVPSSVMLNWEMEFKKWCPGFKILTYYGTPKERKQKRTGWTKVNAFHVCITSYKLVIQDHQSFRRKKWKYLILDEAQNIKNFKSQRWQLLLNFQTEQRLLLTGTPLQNNLMELWSLMHFLMPHVFQSHREFKEWFSNPMTGMIEGNSEYNETIIKRLHKVLRPFLLRRLKCEVEKQMPKKYEHVVMCRLSKRQRFLYDDFMSRAKTRETLASGNLLSVINVLMQLRKVCNHPNMFEERPTISPFRMEGISIKTASLVYNMFSYDPFTQIDLSSLNLVLIQLELLLPAYVAHRTQHLCMPKRLIEEIDSTPLPPPRCPTGKLRLHVRIPDVRVQESLGGNRAGVSITTGVRVGTSPAMKTEGTKFVPLVNHEASLDKKSSLIGSGGSSSSSGIQSRVIDIRRRGSSTVMMMMGGSSSSAGLDSSSMVAAAGSNRSMSPGLLLRKRSDIAGGGGIVSMASPLHQQQQNRLNAGQVVQIIPQVSSGGGIGSNASQSYIITGRLQPAAGGGTSQTIFHRPALAAGGSGGVNVLPTQRIATLQSMGVQSSAATTSAAAAAATVSGASANRMVQNVGQKTQISSTLAATIMKQLKHSKSLAGSSGDAAARSAEAAEMDERQRTEFYLACIEESRKERRREVLELLGRINAKRCDATPIYGRDLRETLCALIEEEFRHRPDELIPFGVASSYHTRRATMARCGGGGGTKNGALFAAASSCLSEAIKSIDQRAGELRATISNFVLFVPAVCAPTPYLQVSHPHPSKLNAEQQWEATMAEQIQPAIQLLHPIISAMSTQFPDPRLIQYDCGKLQTLDRLLKKLKSEGHRVLIFTQMTRMLDVLEAFLNYHGHIYLRLDGTTKVEQRQVLMERFNNDRRMFAFILSTRSGGVGINLTGADTVIFYDSDWNPTMDAQAQDRCHRIGQTRDVHIYRLVSEKTIEENILKKANQKRILGDLAIEGGNFTTAYFKSSTTIQDLFTVDSAEQDASARLAEVLDRDRERKDRLNANLATGPGQPQSATGGEPAVDSSKSAINVFESALAAAEDDQDVQAAKFAKAEASADLDEFDETIPIDEEKVAAAGDAEGKEPELSKAEKEVQNLIKQLSPVERYAMRFVEDTEGTWTAVQLKAVEQEIEQQKRDWEANRLAEQRRNEEAARKREAEEHADLLTFSREDAKNQVNKTHPSNRVSSGGSSKHRLRTMRRNDRTSRVTTATTTAKTMTNRDGGTLKNRANSRGHQVANKYDGGSRSGGRADGGQKLTTATGRRVLASAKQQPKQHSGGVGAKHSGLGNSNKAAGSILGKRKYQESTVAKGGARSQSSKAAVAAAANQRRAKGATRNAKHARRNVSKASFTDDEDEDEDELESDESSNETVQDEDQSNREENGSDSEAAGSGEDGTEEEEEEEQDPLADVGTEDDRAKKQDDAVQGGENAAIVMLRNTPRRASVAARAVIGSMIQKTGVNVKQSPKAATTTNSGGSGGGGGSARAKITRQVPSPVRVAKSSNNAAADRSTVSSASSSSASDAAAAVTTASLAKPLDEFDSECSLDVMVDSNDAPDSDSNQMNSYYNSGNSAGPGMHHDEDARTGGTVDGGGGGSSIKDHQSSRPTSRVGRARDGRSRTPVVSSTSPMVVPASCDLSVDETSDDVDESSNASKTTPRTRSRGTVKINLWTLDDSPMLPVYNRRPNRSKTPQLSQQPNHHHHHLGDDGGDNEERESAECSKKDASSSAVESSSSKPAEANECNSSSSSTVVDNHRDHLNHSSDSSAAPRPPATTTEQQPQKTVANSIVPKTTNVIRNLKVVVNDLLRTPDTAKRVAEVSDGFRAPTPTNTKLRRLKRLSRGVGSAGGRATPPIVMNAGGATYNRTLDGWLTKGGTTATGRKEEADGGSENHGSGGAGGKLPGGEEGSASKLASTVARSRAAIEAAGEGQQHEEKDPLENGNV